MNIYDALGRPTSRNADTFGYNARGEVTAATIDGNAETHEYDSIGNSILFSFNDTTNTYSANSLNQYTSILRASAPPREPAYDADGNMLSDGVLSFTYDAANRLKTVSTNGVQILANFYDAKSRRVKKVTSEATTTFFHYHPTPHEGFEQLRDRPRAPLHVVREEGHLEHIAVVLHLRRDAAEDAAAASHTPFGDSVRVSCW